MANTTWNPSDKTAGITLSGGNLIATRTAGGVHGVRAIDKQVTGKFYWECTCNAFTFVSNFVGYTSTNTNLSSGLGSQGGCLLRQNGDVWVDGNAVSPSINLGGITAGNVVCIAIDCTARLVWFRLGSGGNWNASASANPATGAGGAAFSSISNGIPVCPVVSLANASDQVTANFGDTAFTGTVPSGFASGFTAGATVNTNVLATQVAVEEWYAPTPAAQVTQAAIEQWFVPSPDAQVTQVAAEHWFTTNPDAQVTQVALEHWTSVQATFTRPAHPSTVLSGSRAGVGSVVLSS